jgi:hypothetical protein
MSEAPIANGAPSAHQLIFGPAPGASAPAPAPLATPASIPTIGGEPQPEPPSDTFPAFTAQIQGQPPGAVIHAFTRRTSGQAWPSRPGPVVPLIPGDRKRTRVLTKLSRRGTLLPIAAAVVVLAVVASVLAVGGFGGSSGSGSSGSSLSKSASGTDRATTHPSATTGGKPGVALDRHLNTVSIRLLSPSDDPRPDVTVKIGNDPTPLHVVLDTGSVGLRVFSNLLPTGIGKGIDVTTQQDSIEYVDGTTFSGPVAKALVHIGSLTTTRTVPFELVQSVTCDPQIPYCPASGGAAQFEADDVDGIMGIGLGGVYQGDPSTNPLLSLPAPYRDSWSIAMSGNGVNLPAPGTLVLGAQDPANPAAQFSLQQQGAVVDGLPSWNDQFNLCWDVGGLSNCELTVFDSGSDLTVLGGNGFSNVPTDAPGEVATLTTGTQVQCSQEVNGNPLWSFNAGGGTMQTVYVEPDGSDWVNSGVQAFYSFTVTYDEKRGDIFLS